MLWADGLVRELGPWEEEVWLCGAFREAADTGREEVEVERADKGLELIDFEAEWPRWVFFLVSPPLSTNVFLVCMADSVTSRSAVRNGSTRREYAIHALAGTYRLIRHVFG